MEEAPSLLHESRELGHGHNQHPVSMEPRKSVQRVEEPFKTAEVAGASGEAPPVEDNVEGEGSGLGGSGPGHEQG